MIYPIDEHAFESASNGRLAKAGAWARHMDTSIPGFPDTTVMHPAPGGFFVEYKYIRARDINATMVSIFQPDQISQFIAMMQKGARIRLAAYYNQTIYTTWLSVNSLLALRDITCAQWMAGEVDSYHYEELATFARDILK